MVNRQFLLASRPVGMPKESDFQMVEAPLPIPQAGEMLLRALYLSVDPYMRGRMNAAKSYAPSVEIGGLMVGAAVAEVVESNNADFKSGDIVAAYTGWQEYAVSSGQGVRKVDAAVAPVSTALGVLGMPGLTAYYGVHDICEVKPGETVVVSGAAGAVGSVAGQIAKIIGCRVVGVAGGSEKVNYVTEELGFDAALDYKALDYKTASDYADSLRKLCPDRIDAYFDNVGGPVSDAVFMNLNLRARIAICGQISLYNNTEPPQGPRLLSHLLVARAKVQGFLIFDYTPQQSAHALAELSEWVRAGRIKYREDVVEGFENMPRALIGLFSGENIGKRVVKVR